MEDDINKFISWYERCVLNKIDGSHRVFSFSFGDGMLNANLCPDDGCCTDSVDLMALYESLCSLTKREEK